MTPPHPSRTLRTLTQWLQMGQRVFIIALMASFCVALPMTDLVVPEAKDARTSGAEVLVPSRTLPSPARALHTFACNLRI